MTGENEIDQETLDRVVEVLASPKGSESITRIREALYARMDKIQHSINNAQAEGRDVYKAFRALGGARYLGFEDTFKVKPPEEPQPTPEPEPKPEPEPEPEPEEVPIPDRTTPVYVDTAHGLEVIPPANKGRSIRGLASKPRYKGGAYSESGGISYQEFLAFANLVIDEYGIAPTQRAAAKYFGVSQTAIGRVAHYAEDLGLYEVPSTGRLIPPGFEDMIATRFGKYRPGRK